MRNESVGLQRNLRASARPAAKPAGDSPRPTKNKAPKSGGLTSFSDDNAIADPEAAAAVARRHRRYAMANYRGAIDSLQLEQAEKERLKRLIAERWIARADVNDLVQRRGESTPGLRKSMIDAVMAEADEKIRDLLGDDGFSQLEASYEEQSTKSMNWGLFTSAWDVGAPITGEQQILVARAMVQVKGQFPSPEVANEIDPTTGLTRSDIALLELSAAFLSPEQVAVIRADKTATAEYRNALRESEQRRQADLGRRTP